MVPLFQDELQTTTKSYEGQLSMMSEHLAGMNEKLTQQKDEIDDLRSQLSVAKVSTSKVHVLFMFTNFNVYTSSISSVFKITIFHVSMHVFVIIFKSFHVFLLLTFISYSRMNGTFFFYVAILIVPTSLFISIFYPILLYYIQSTNIDSHQYKPIPSTFCLM